MLNSFTAKRGKYSELSHPEKFSPLICVNKSCDEPLVSGSGKVLWAFAWHHNGYGICLVFCS